MLSRAATMRAVRIPTLASSIIPRSSSTFLLSATSSSPLNARSYASSNNKGRKAPPAPTARSAAARPPPAQPLAGNARQTAAPTTAAKSPVAPAQQPKIRTAATPPSSPSKAAPIAGAAAAGAGVVSPVQGARPTGQPAQDSKSSQEPIAQKENLDEPVPGSARDIAQDGIAASENTPAPESGEAEKPLPDLRFGIPSTFDIEFGDKKGAAEAKETEDNDKFDVTSAPEDGSWQKEKGDREYDASAYETSADRRRNQMANYLFAATLLAAIGGAVYFARPFPADDDIPNGLDPSDAYSWSPTSMWSRVRARMGSQMGYYTEPSFDKLLPEVPENQRQPFTLVLSLEDLMIHTTWDTKNGYRLAKRPGLDYFIRYLSQYYELVLFTSAPRAMADPVMAKLDPYHFIMWPLGREATKYENGEYIKDLAYLNRPLSKTIIIDTHAPHVKNQPENAIILPKWDGKPDSPHTKDLVALIPFLEYVATMGTEDVRTVLKSFEGKDIPQEFARREAIARERFNAEIAAERRRKPKVSLGSFAGALGVSGKGMGGGMVLADGQSVAEGLAQGKMLSDQIREQGQKQYEYLEKQIRENGEQWLKEEKEEQQRLMEQSMKDMKKSTLGWFGGGKE